MNIQFKQTPNYAKGTGVKKTAIVWHGTLGAYKGAVNWLSMTKEQRGTDSESSAHFVIGRNEGEIIQLVDMKDIAWQAGKVSNPNERFKKIALKDSRGMYVNPNQWTIGIEFCWGYDIDKDGDIDEQDKTLNEWQLKCAKDIHDKFSVMFDVAVTKENTLTHSEIASYKSDNLIKDINRYYSEYLPSLVKPKEEICLDNTVVVDLKQKVQNKEVLGIFSIIKKLLALLNR
jgi:N-acetyl-anhydromuramyl-L-alanine amidase AmpD